jgi:cytochrome c5
MNGPDVRRRPQWVSVAVCLFLAALPAALPAAARCDDPAVAVARANDEFEDAHRSGDVAAMGRLLAADFELFHSGAVPSQVEDRAAFIKRLSGMPPGLFLSRKVDGLVVRQFGDIATASGYLTTTSKSRWTGNRIKENRFHFLRVFRRQGCGWTMVNWHSGWAAQDRKEADFITDYLARFPAEAASTPGVAANGEQVYREACAFCHDNGAMGAPLRADRKYWKNAAADMARLYERALVGYAGERGVMPAKGGRVDLPDTAVRAAVDHLVAADTPTPR